MLDHYVLQPTQPEQTQPSPSPDLAAGLVVALVVTMVVLKYLRVVLFLLAFSVVAVLFIGILEIEPLIAQVIEGVQTPNGS